MAFSANEPKFQLGLLFCVQ